MVRSMYTYGMIQSGYSVGLARMETENSKIGEIRGRSIVAHLVSW